jgi:hypothetical protein
MLRPRSAIAASLLLVAVAGCSRITAATVSSTGEQANYSVSSGPTLSTNGRFVAYDSEATNLVPDDTNGTSDVFVHDGWTGRTERLSVAPDGTQGNGLSSLPKISGNGRFVVFKSDATNLVPGDTNGVTDVFVRDRWLRRTRRVSVSSSGAQANGVSSQNCFPNISADGRVVSFVSYASNLVPGDTNGTADTFVHVLRTGRTEMVSVASDGTHDNGWAGGDTAVSGDGRFVVFAAEGDNLVPGWTNHRRDVFVHDRRTGHTERVSVASDGTEGNADGMDLGLWITADGRYVCFRSYASNLVPGDTNGTTDVFVRDRLTGRTERVSVASGGVQAHGEADRQINDATLSNDGRFVLFDSFANDLVPTPIAFGEHVYLHDRLTDRTSRVSQTADGTPGDYWSGNSQISGDGRVAAFGTVASNLIPNDANGFGFDIAVAQLSPP